LILNSFHRIKFQLEKIMSCRYIYCIMVFFYLQNGVDVVYESIGGEMFEVCLNA
jgi:hypothetical protein